MEERLHCDLHCHARLKETEGVEEAIADVVEKVVAQAGIERGKLRLVERDRERHVPRRGAEERDADGGDVLKHLHAALVIRDANHEAAARRLYAARPSAP